MTLATHRLFQAEVEAAGLTWAQITVDPRSASRDEGVRRWQAAGANPLLIIGRFRRVARPHLERYLEECLAAVSAADLVLFSPLGVGAYHAAEAADVPAWPAFLQPLRPTAEFPSPLVPPGVHRLGGRFRRMTHWAVQLGAWRALAPEINRFRRRLGLKALPLGPYRRLDEDRVPHLYGFSPSLVPPPVDWPSWVYVTGYWNPPLQAGLPPGLEDLLGESPVFVGFGSRMHPRVPIDLLLRALPDVPILLQPGWGGIEPVQGVETIGYVDHRLVFPRCRMVIHHGGAGTTHTALAAGVPTVVVPSFADQFFWAWRVEQTGTGVSLPLRRLTPRRLRQAVERAGSLAGKAAEVGRLVSQEDGASRAADLVSRLA